MAKQLIILPSIFEKKEGYIEFRCGKHDELLEEFSADLNEAGIVNERLTIILNSVDTGGYTALAAAAGAGLTILGQVISTYINKNKGQRSVAIQIRDGTEIKNIEVKAQSVEEINKLLKSAQMVFLKKTK